MASRWLILASVTLAYNPLSAIGQTPTADGESAYVASERGQVYYWIGCDGWRSLGSALRFFTTSAEAEAAGYRPSQTPGCGSPERTAGPTPLETGTCTIERVIDGDTVVCREAGEHVRLLLVDTPELAQRPFGIRALEFLEGLLPRGSVAKLEFDVQSRDPYRRILAYLYRPDGSMVNEAVARAGFGVVGVYPPNVRYVERIRAAVEEARAAKRGLWSGSAFDCVPADYRAGRCGAQ
jgi:micrococcal nuclease